MKKEAITQNQALSVVAMFTIGSNLIFGLGRKSMQDTWISMLIALAAFVPYFYMVMLIIKRYPGMSLFEICAAAFGKVAGKIAIVLFTWYAFHVGFLVMRYLSQYIQVRVFNRMPQTITMLGMAVLVIWAARRGVEALGRIAVILLPLTLLLILGTTAMLAKDCHPSYLLPVGEHIAQVPEDAFHNFALPLAETIIFFGLANATKQGSKPGRAWFLGVLIGWTFLLIAFFRNATSLGFPTLEDKWFPSYEASSLIIAGTFISRIENIFGVNVLLVVFIKITVCLLVAAKGTASIFNAEDYRRYVAPTGLLMVAFASIVYKSMIEQYNFLNIFPYYSIPFELLLPLALCIAAEIRLIVKNKREQGKPSGPAPA